MEEGNLTLKTAKWYFYLWFYEFIGTIYLFTGINFSQGDPIYVVGCIFMACIVTGRCTGGHFNMAFSLTIYLLEGKFLAKWKCLLTYFFGEICGGYMGMYLSYLMLGKDHIAYIKPRDMSYSVGYVFFVETFAAFV
jgi:glycerol uptake facilitator-like aquaporin